MTPVEMAQLIPTGVKRPCAHMERKRISWIVIAVIIGTNVLYGQNPEWFVKSTKVRLFEMERAEFEKHFPGLSVLDTYTGAVGTQVSYEISEGKISALYSNGLCRPGSSYGFNVPKGVIIKFKVSLNPSQAMDDMNIDLSRFEKYEISDVVGLFTYTDEENGIQLSGTATELNSINFFPSRKQSKLDCAELKLGHSFGFPRIPAFGSLSDLPAS